MISYIIPHKNRHGMLMHHIELAKKQSFANVEIIVVDDHSDEPPEIDGVTVVTNDGHGPAAARNTGAKASSHDYILFVGDDCFPSRDLCLHHYNMLEAGAQSVQGFTPFHPMIMTDEFMFWLDQSGLQANWGSLKTETGWKSRIDGFCLTTNYSIRKNLFLNIGGFDEKYFKDAAWEDVAFGQDAAKFGIETYFSPDAVNFHWHKYTASTFMDRQRMVGRNAVNLCLAKPEVASSIVAPSELRDVAHIDEVKHAEFSLRHAPSNLDGVQGIKSNLWAAAMRIAFINGFLDAISDSALLAAKFMNNNKSLVYLFSAFDAATRGDYGYLSHAIEWIIKEEPTNWAVYAFAGKVLGDSKYYEKASELMPGWKHEYTALCS